MNDFMFVSQRTVVVKAMPIAPFLTMMRTSSRSGILLIKDIICNDIRYSLAKRYLLIKLSHSKRARACNNFFSQSC